MYKYKHWLCSKPILLNIPSQVHDVVSHKTLLPCDDIIEGVNSQYPESNIKIWVKKNV